MPWCPRCDESFPQGPVCPRCATRLLDRGGDEDLADAESTLHAVPGLRQIKVSRRYRRALERLSGPRAPSSRSLAFALVLLVFAVGFLLGRLAGVGTIQPAVRAMPPAEALPFSDIRGSATYLVRNDQSQETLLEQTLNSGELVPLAPFASPFSAAAAVQTKISTLHGSIAVVASDGRQSRVAFVREHEVHGWIPGVQAAWVTPGELIVREVDGSLVRWTAGEHGFTARPNGKADQILQTAAGAVRRVGDELRMVDGERTLALPKAEDVLAVAPGLQYAVIDPEHPAVWDGQEAARMRIDESYDAVGASFDVTGEKAATLLRRADRVSFGIAYPRGQVQLVDLGSVRDECAATPVWDSAGRWVYVTLGEGLLTAIEAGGQRVEQVQTNAVGCGLGWLNES